jgi:pimeloyl-ACP methyl ester carboxylesterase
MDRNAAALPRLITEDLHVASATPGVRIHLRRKVLADPEPLTAGRRNVVVFVHGATYPGPSAYDAPLPGGSWLDYAATRGHDAYAVSVRGYGLSSRPAPASHPPFLDRPYARTADAIADLSGAVEAIRARTGAERVDLVGWSWGTAICGGYAARHPDRVGRLVLYAPLWILCDTPRPPWMRAWLPMFGLLTLSRFYSACLGAFRNVSLDDVRRRWFRGLDERTAASLCPPESMALWWRHTVESGGDATATELRAPNGVLADLAEYWAAGVPTYDPGRITAPVLAVVGEWDRETPPVMAQELFERLTSSPHKRLEVLGRGTHAMSLEANRFDLYERVQQFLEAARPDATR